MTEPAIDLAVEEYTQIIRVKPFSFAAKQWFTRNVRILDPSLIINGWIPIDKGPGAVEMLEGADRAGLNLVPVTPHFFSFAWNSSMPKPEFVVISQEVTCPSDPHS